MDLRPQPAGEAHCSFETCDGSGFLVDEATNTARDCACRAQRIANARAHRLRDHVPRRYMDLSWDRYPLTQIAQDPNADSVRVVKRFCADGCVLTAGQHNNSIAEEISAGERTITISCIARGVHVTVERKGAAGSVTPAIHVID